MDFSSDNAYGVMPEIAAAMLSENRGSEMAYGNDSISYALPQRFCEYFNCQVAVYPVVTGTAANALILGTIVPPHGAVICHADSHIMTHECGAPEFYSNGARLIGINGADGKLSVAAVAQAADAHRSGYVHNVQPAAVSLAQPTEAGTVYTPTEVEAIAAAAHSRGMKLHMDGARFANAVARLGCSPAEITWKCGVDALSFGASKGGAMAAEAAVFFGPENARDFEFRRKRGGHLISKMRFISVQLDTYLQNDLWLSGAVRANRLASRLGDAIHQSPDGRLLHPVEANIVFAELPEKTIARLREAGARFYVLGDGEGDVRAVRLVTSFATPEADVESFIKIID